MAKDTIQLSLEGEVSLADFRVAIDALLGLLESLTQQAADGEDAVEWIVSDLQYGSATIAARGKTDTADGRHVIKNVVKRYDHIAESASLGKFDEIDPIARNYLEALTSAINGRIPRIRMGGENDWAIEAPIKPQAFEPSTLDPEKARSSRTSIKGKIIMLGDKQTIYFTLQEAFTKRSVRCYPTAKWRKVIADYWAEGRWILVEGTLNRFTQVPTVTMLTDIVPLGEADPGGWRKAFGIAHGEGEESASDILRRIRDAS